MRVPGNTPKKSPSLKAAQHVADENCQPINLKDNTNFSIPNKQIYHKYIDNITGLTVEKNSQDLINLANKFVNWVRQQTEQPLFQTFWNTHGFDMDSINKLCKSEPEFAQRLNYGKELIGELSWRRLSTDIQTLRQRSSIYIKEFKDHDIEMMEQAAKIKINAEKDIKLEEMKRPIQIIMQDFSKGEDNDGDKK